jgi:IstB-like ATP binding protein
MNDQPETPTPDTPQVLLEHHLKALRLPTILSEYDKVARQCATEQVEYPRYLLRLTELELLDRDRRAVERRIRQAKFPVVKSLDSFEFLAIPSLSTKRWSWSWHDASSCRAKKIFCSSGTVARARLTSRWRSACLLASVVIVCASLPPLRWSVS